MGRRVRARIGLADDAPTVSSNSPRGARRRDRGSAADGPAARGV